MNILSPSILSADFKKLGEEIIAVEKAGAQYIHIDVMDGVFVPSISFGMPIIKSIRSVTNLIFDVHLMISSPEKYVDEFAKCGADIITIHLETLSTPEQTLKHMKSLGVKVGIAINPETPIQKMEPFLPLVDMVLIMTVNPGFGGQSYIEACTDKIIRARKMIDQLSDKNHKIDLEVDGGICKDNLSMVVEIGANIIVMGSAIYDGDPYENAKSYMEIINK